MCCGPYNALERKRARSRAAASGAGAYLWNAAPCRGSAELPRARLAVSRAQPSPSNYQASSLQSFAVSSTVFTSKFSHTAPLQFCFHFDKYMQQTTVGRREPYPFIFLAPRQDCQGKQTLHSQSTWFFWQLWRFRKSLPSSFQVFPTPQGSASLSSTLHKETRPVVCVVFVAFCQLHRPPAHSQHHPFGHQHAIQQML